MPTYTVFPIEPPASPSQLAAYKTLRLASLQIDPQAFISTHARELTLSEDVWRQRLDSSSKRTFIAAVANDPDPSFERGDVNTGVEETTGQWVGSACIVEPSDMVASSVTAPFKEAGMDANWEIYGLYAMWVHPAHRGNGVGTKLVNTCLEWARTHVDVRFANASENAARGDVEKVVVLLVYDDNVAGRMFYSRAGFIELEEVPAEEGQRWMLAKV